MTEIEMKKLILKLRRIAKDVRETAVGSSRIQMYASLAAELEAEADRLELEL